VVSDLPYNDSLNRRSVLCGGASALALGTAYPAARAHATVETKNREKPNVILILADNLGWGELGVYGGGLLRGAPTPRLDRFAGEGLRLLNFNVEVSCTPTRSALLTGRYSIRTGAIGSVAPGERSYGLVRWEKTLAELLSEQGYSTAMFGKWHLGNDEGRYPNDRGFDEWYGIPRTTGEVLDRLSPGYDPSVVPPEYILRGKKGEKTVIVREYTIDERRKIDTDLVSFTSNYIKARAKTGNPFFLYLPLTQVHYPTLPSAEFQGRTGNGDFADSVVEMDSHVGEVLDAIDAAGISNNTVVIFASDNGPEYRRPWRGTAGFWRGTYHTALEGSLRAPFMIRWPGRVPVGVSNEIVHAVDIFTTLSGLGGAQIPTDRPIDGVNQLEFFTGRQQRSNRESFPVYIDEDLYAVKWRNWKYHLMWLDDAAEKARELKDPYLFNVLGDPKEETPRVGAEDGWVIDPIKKVITEMQSSLREYPAIPEGAPDSYVPQHVVKAPVQRRAT